MRFGRVCIGAKLGAKLDARVGLGLGKIGPGGLAAKGTTLSRALVGGARAPTLGSLAAKGGSGWANSAVAGVSGPTATGFVQSAYLTGIGATDPFSQVLVGAVGGYRSGGAFRGTAIGSALGGGIAPGVPGALYGAGIAGLAQAGGSLTTLSEVAGGSLGYSIAPGVSVGFSLPAAMAHNQQQRKQAAIEQAKRREAARQRRVTTPYFPSATSPGEGESELDPFAEGGFMTQPYRPSDGASRGDLSFDTSLPLTFPHALAAEKRRQDTPIAQAPMERVVRQQDSGQAPVRPVQQAEPQGGVSWWEFAKAYAAHGYMLITPPAQAAIDRHVTDPLNELAAGSRVIQEETRSPVEAAYHGYAGYFFEQLAAGSGSVLQTTRDTAGGLVTAVENPRQTVATMGRSVVERFTTGYSQFPSSDVSFLERTAMGFAGLIGANGIFDAIEGVDADGNPIQGDWLDRVAHAAPSIREVGSWLYGWSRPASIARMQVDAEKLAKSRRIGAATTPNRRAGQVKARSGAGVHSQHRSHGINPDADRTPVDHANGQLHANAGNPPAANQPVGPDGPQLQPVMHGREKDKASPEITHESVQQGQVASAYPRDRRVGGRGESRRPTDPPPGWVERGAWELTLDNIRRMEAGRPPMGRDGSEIVLHHRNHSRNGPLDEMTSELHRSIEHPKSPSEINRSVFSGERARYWRTRVRILLGQER